jgi:hypothetical protein
MAAGAMTVADAGDLCARWLLFLLMSRYVAEQVLTDIRAPFQSANVGGHRGGNRIF